LVDQTHQRRAFHAHVIGQGHLAHTTAQTANEQQRRGAPRKSVRGHCGLADLPPLAPGQHQLAGKGEKKGIDLWHGQNDRCESIRMQMISLRTG
jgi:hypothetical protein